MALDFHLTLTVDVPQLAELAAQLARFEERFMPTFEDLVDMINDTKADLTAALDTELTQIADKLAAIAQNPTTAQIDAVPADLLAFKDAFHQRIADIVTDAPLQP